MTVVLDGRLMTNRDAVHDQLSEQIPLPAYYGRNLDALYDALTDLQQPLELMVMHCFEMEVQLGSYAQALISTLKDAAKENPYFSVSFYNHEK